MRTALLLLAAIPLACSSSSGTQCDSSWKATLTATATQTCASDPEVLVLDARSATDIALNGTALSNCQDDALAGCTHDVLCGESVRYYVDLGINGFVSLRIVHASCETDYSAR
jgi:hypothetical protein